MHFVRCLTQLRSKSTPMEKNIYLSQLKGVDENMFYRLCLQHMSEVTPIIYTPTVGDACLQFSHNWRRPEGLVRLFLTQCLRTRSSSITMKFISYEDKGRIAGVLKNWPRLNEARIAVVTDGEHYSAAPSTWPFVCRSATWRSFLPPLDVL